MAVYQSKSVTKDGKSFFYKVQYTTGDSEETRTKVSKKYATREEAMQAEHDFLIWIVDYKDVPVDMTFQELYDKFLEDRKQVCKFTTLATYPNMYKYLKVFMKIKCVDYDIEHFNKWKKQMVANKKICLRYKNDILKHWKSVLNFGTRWYDFNFLSVYRKMDKFKEPNGLKKEMKYYTLPEFKKFISGEEDSMWRCYFQTLYYCGLRCGESRGLMWKDIDFNKKLLSVNRQVIDTPKDWDEPYVISDPKTKTSRRVIPICNVLLDAFNIYKNELESKNQYNINNFVFSPSDGTTPLRDNHILTRKKKIEKATGSKHIRTHDFRHSCASLLINSGGNVSMVAKYLGHSEVEETLNTYSHMFPSALDDVLNIVNNLKKGQ